MGIISVRSRTATDEQVWNGNTAMIAYKEHGRLLCCALAGPQRLCTAPLGVLTVYTRPL